MATEARLMPDLYRATGYQLSHRQARQAAFGCVADSVERVIPEQQYWPMDQGQKAKTALIKLEKVTLVFFLP